MLTRRSIPRQPPRPPRCSPARAIVPPRDAQIGVQRERNVPTAYAITNRASSLHWRDDRARTVVVLYGLIAAVGANVAARPTAARSRHGAHRLPGLSSRSARSRSSRAPARRRGAVPQNSSSSAAAAGPGAPNALRPAGAAEVAVVYLLAPVATPSRPCARAGFTGGAHGAGDRDLAGSCGDRASGGDARTIVLRRPPITLGFRPAGGFAAAYPTRSCRHFLAADAARRQHYRARSAATLRTRAACAARGRAPSLML